MQVGTPLCIPSKGGIMLGKIASMELNHKPVDVAKRGDNVALKIEAQNAEESSRLYGRHFDFKVSLCFHNQFCKSRSSLLPGLPCILPACRQALRHLPQPLIPRCQLCWFIVQDKLISKISRKSIDLLKKHFKDDLEKDDWRLVIKLKKTFAID